MMLRAAPKPARPLVSPKLRQSARGQATCGTCGSQFDRDYYQCLQRRAKPQYCSRTCQNAAHRQRANEKFSERFWSKVDTSCEAGCWPWIGKSDNRGYGHFGRAGFGQVKAHRVAYELHHGEAPGSLHVLHSCDNPACCNPRHLRLGTHAENMRDMAERKRGGWSGRVGERINTAKITADDARAIFASNEASISLSRKYGISTFQIRRIRNGKSWGHATGGVS